MKKRNEPVVTGFHATNAPDFRSFRDDRFAFFFHKEKDAQDLADRIRHDDEIARIHGVCSTARVIPVRITGRVIDESIALNIWNAETGSTDDAFIYSMMCHVTNEFPAEDVTKFLLGLRSRGIAAVCYCDYCPSNSDVDSRAYAVASPSAIKIL